MSDKATSTSDNDNVQTPTVLALDKDGRGRAAALAALSELYPAARVIGASSQRELEKDWSGPMPKLALVAFELDAQNGLEATRRILKFSPDTQVLVYAKAIPETVRRQLFELGAGVTGAPVSAECILNALDCRAAECALISSTARAAAFT